MSYEQELREFRDVLDSVEVVGYPKRQTELARLAELIHRYPEEARDILNRRDRFARGE